MLRNLINKIKVVQLLTPASIAADTLTDGINITGFRSFAFIVNAASMVFTNTDKIALEFLESADGITYVAAPLTSYVGGVVPEMNTAAFSNAATVVEYKGNAPYVKMNLNVSGTVAVNMTVTGLSTDLLAQPS